MKLIRVNRLMPFILFLFVSFFCYAQQSSALRNDLPKTLNLDGKDWRIGFENNNTSSHIIEYVIKGENVEKWTELFTIQKFKFTFPKQVTPIIFANTEIENLRKKGYKYDYIIFESSPGEAIIEFRIMSPKNEQQDELQRLIKTADNQFVVLHYAVKKSDMGKKERTKWINILKAFKV